MNSILKWFYVKEIVSRNYKSNLKLPAQSPASVHFEESPIFPFNFVECSSSWFILPYLPDGGNIFQLLSAHKVSFLYPGTPDSTHAYLLHITLQDQDHDC